MDRNGRHGLPDRRYVLNGSPQHPGLWRQDADGSGGWGALQGDSPGRAAIRLVQTPTGPVRVDSFLLSVNELGLRPGDTLRLNYLASSPQPAVFINAAEEAGLQAASGMLAFFEVTMVLRGARLDAQSVPDDSRRPDVTARDLQSAGSLAEGFFAFPQREAAILIESPQLRLAWWNNREYLLVQAVLGEDSSPGIGRAADGSATGDFSVVELDSDDNGRMDPRVDRSYWVNPWPDHAGLFRQIRLDAPEPHPLDRDTQGRASIRYVRRASGGLFRVDTMAIPLKELSREPGQPLRLRWASISAEPQAVWRSTPEADWHRVMLVDRDARIDLDVLWGDAGAASQPASRVRGW
jgi:hypothetical protein